MKEQFFTYLQSQTLDRLTAPILHVIQIGQDLASTKYVGIKQKMAQRLSIDLRWHQFPTTISPEPIQKILEYVKSQGSGLIFQLPVPTEFDFLVKQTPLSGDVDFLGSYQSLLWQQGLLPPTIGAIDLILKDILWNESEKTNIQALIERPLSLRGKTICVIGQGLLVGGPMLNYLKQREATIISVNIFTKNTAELSQLADIVICAAGSQGIVTKDWLKPEAIVIDAATSESDGQLIGDLDLRDLPESVTVCTSPKGVGSITVLYLFHNLLRLPDLRFEQLS